MAFDKIQWIKDRPYLCDSPSTTYDFRIFKNTLSASCCCNLDRDKVDGTPEYLDSIRETLRQKQTHPACHLCYQDEDNNVLSERMRYLLPKSQEQLKLFEQTQELDCVNISIKFSNLCNLACRSCNPRESSLHAKLLKVESLVKDRSIDITENIDHWNIITGFIKQTYDKFNTTKTIVLRPVGGETLLQAGFQKLLGWLVETGMAKDIRVDIISSLSVPLDSTLFELLKKFKYVHISASIDSVGVNYNQVRWPLTFDKLQKNLETVLNIVTAGSFLVLPVFSLNNIFYMSDILDWWDTWFTEHPAINKQMDTIHLHDPEHLTVENIPNPYRQTLIPIIDNCYNHKIFNNNDAGLMVLKEYIGLIKTHLTNNDDGNISFFEHYLEETARYDRLTKSDSFVGNQKLFNLLTQEHVDRYRSTLTG
jgi:hypothetical protein